VAPPLNEIFVEVVGEAEAQRLRDPSPAAER